MNDIRFPFVNLPAMVAALILGILITGCDADRGAETVEPVAIRVATPARMNLAKRIPYLGTVHARTEVQINAQVQGTVVALPRDEGDRVRKGELLLRLDAPELEAAVQRLRSERDYLCERSATDERLLAQGVIPEDQAEAGRKACSSAEAALREVTARVARSVEHAPMNATVLRRFVDNGQHVMPGQPLLLLGDDEVEIRVEAVEEDLRRGIEVGIPVDIHSGNGTVRGRVREIAARGNMPSRTFTVKIAVEKRDDILRRNGVSLPVEFIVATAENAIAIPVNAVADREGDPHIYLVTGNVVHRQKIRTGIEDGGMVEAHFSWNGTDRVALTNLRSLRDSTVVYPLDAGEVRR
ncbi:MAG: efflux RND transporter periplasmic adaptor subunit [Bacteroidetes bacterium]|nr:efflux RND transporter periplasmic adaptor subunit [Bacteroidota bacterium]